MLYSVDKIVEDWRARQGLDRTAHALEGFHDVETLTLREYVLVHIEQVVNSVEMTAPSYLLEGLKPLPDTVFSMDGGGGWIDLPDDFMRLVSVRLSGWRVTLEMEMTPAEYEREISEFAGVRASVNRPRCRVTRRAHGPVLEVFPVVNNMTAKTLTAVEEGSYLPARHLDSGAIFISQKCYDAVLAALPPLPKLIP